MFRKIPKSVIVLGIVSFFNDVAAEMIYPLVPLFLSTVLQAPIHIIGLIEGIAEATASLMKFFFGYMSDRFDRRKPFVIAGYSFAALSKVLISIAYVWPFVLFARIIDRMGKGIRTSPRDALLLQNATATNKGLIFGFHRSMDSAGAVVGPLVALLLLTVIPNNFRLIFLLACIPSIIGVVLVLLFVKEVKEPTKSGVPGKDRMTFPIHWKHFRPELKLFFFISVVFALGNSSDAFILLRAKDLGLSTVFVTLSYVLYNVSQTVFATPAGRLADKIGARKVYAGGLVIFAFVYFLFAVIPNPFWMWFLFPVYGIYIAFTDGVSKAYIADFISPKEAGSFFGLYQTALSVATFFASYIGGVLWSSFHPSATFYFGSFMALLAFLILFWGKTVHRL